MRRNNVTLIPAHPVRDIIVEDNRAVGVRLENGDEFRATKLVASSVDMHQTFEKMLPQEVVPESVKKRLETYEYQEATLYSVHMAMDKIPTYKAAAFDPDINDAWIVNAGYETLDDLNKDWEEIRAGKIPADPNMTVSFNTLFDPSDAPEGKATGLLRIPVPSVPPEEGAEIWNNKFSNDYAEKCIEKLLEYTDADFSADDIIKARPYTPVDTATKLINMVNGDWMVGRIAHDNLMGDRPSKELAEYRTPIDGLYLCGSCTHPHGYITFGPAYNALKSIAEDYELDTWWEEI